MGPAGRKIYFFAHRRHKKNISLSPKYWHGATYLTCKSAIVKEPSWMIGHFDNPTSHAWNCRCAALTKWQLHIPKSFYGAAQPVNHIHNCNTNFSLQVAPFQFSSAKTALANTWKMAAAHCALKSRRVHGRSISDARTLKTRVSFEKVMGDNKGKLLFHKDEWICVVLWLLDAVRSQNFDNLCQEK